MQPIPPLAIVIAAFTLFLGLFFGLYALLTRTRRQVMREIRTGAAARGWRYRLRRWQGDPTSFRIDGQTGNGLPWILKTTGTRGYDRGWSVRLGLQFPTLAGQADVSIFPRDAGSGVPASAGANLLAAGAAAKFSESAAETIRLLQAGREFPSGLGAFDQAYQVLALPRFAAAPVDAALAQRMMQWPADAIRPHSLLMWRDPTALHFQARLPAPPNWATISYFLGLAEDLCQRLPAPDVPATGPTVADRVIARILE